MTPTILLNDGRPMPRLGLGTWQMEGADATRSVAAAIECGYRLIDTAAIYENETEVGRGLKSSKVKREELFVTTKLWNNRHDSVPAALKESLKKLGLDYVDLYLIHWPSPRQNRYLEAWRSLIELQKAGLTRSIGVSNFHEEHLAKIIAATGVAPAVNQIELHPTLQQKKLAAVDTRHGIVTQTWSPLGRGADLEDRVIVGIAQKLSRTPAQVVLRWHLQQGYSPIPKSITPARIRENFGVYDFTLTAADLSALAPLDAAQRMGPNPDAFG